MTGSSASINISSMNNTATNNNEDSTSTAAHYRLGMLGGGTVASAFAEMLSGRDLPVSLAHILVRDLAKTRTQALLVDRLTTDAELVVDDADIIIELMGGTDQAGDLMLRALAAGKPVITANKAALAERWDEFLPYLGRGQVYFESAVMAGTPIVAALTGGLRASKPIELHAILNGTCNYMLQQLEAGTAFADALAEAQALGYAEADPSLDIDGFDAAHKLAILGRLAFNPELTWDAVKVNTIGIRELTPAVVQEAMEDGGRVRLVGSIYPQEGIWQAVVRPVYLPASHPLSGSASERNGMVFRSDSLGYVSMIGPGAGGKETASGILADLYALLDGQRGPAPLQQAAEVPEGVRIDKLGEVLE
ncbi:MAG: homoserine dehydrogenase [Deinococcota bacterium]